MSQSLPQVAGKKRFREDTAGSDPFIAINTDKKKAKPAPEDTPEEDQEEEEFLDLTTGKKRGGTETGFGPETRGDIEASENVPIQLTAPETETVTQAPLGAGGAE